MIGEFASIQKIYINRHYLQIMDFSKIHKLILQGEYVLARSEIAKYEGLGTNLDMIDRSLLKCKIYLNTNQVHEVIDLSTHLIEETEKNNGIFTDNRLGNCPLLNSLSDILQVFFSL